MSGKRLLPLAALLIILVLVAVVLKRQPAPPRLSEEVGFERLVPEALRADSIRGVDLYQGTKPEQVVRLRRQGDVWVAASHYDAPVQADKIRKFLETLSTLEGELRADQAELLGDFRLNDAQALHLRLYTDNPETPAVHLLAGKTSGRHSFMRLASQTRVYSVNLHLHSEAGLPGSDTEQPPQARPWLALQIQDLPQEQITALELHTPERTLHFARQQPPAASATEGQQAAASQPAEATAGWTLVAPAVPYAVKQGGLGSLVSALRTLRAEDIADPARLAEYGLENPAFRAVITLQAANQEARQAPLLVGQTVPEQAEKRSARLGTQGPIYILPAWVFNRVFPAARELLELPQLALQPADVQRVAWQQGTESWTLERHPAPSQTTETAPTSATWRLVEAPQHTVDEKAVNTLLEAISHLSIDDWLEHPAQPTGLDQPQLVLQVARQDGQSQRLTIGSSRPNDADGHYASLADAPGTLVVSAATYKTLTEALPPLRPADSSSADATPASR
jgi:hypothetical protein